MRHVIYIRHDGDRLIVLVFPCLPLDKCDRSERRVETPFVLFLLFVVVLREGGECVFPSFIQFKAQNDVPGAVRLVLREGPLLLYFETLEGGRQLSLVEVVLQVCPDSSVRFASSPVDGDVHVGHKDCPGIVIPLFHLRWFRHSGLLISEACSLAEGLHDQVDGFLEIGEDLSEADSLIV